MNAAMKGWLDQFQKVMLSSVEGILQASKIYVEALDADQRLPEF